MNFNLFFASLASITTGIVVSAGEIKSLCYKSEIKKYESIFKRKWKKHDKKNVISKKLNSIKVLISKALINS